LSERIAGRLTVSTLSKITFGPAEEDLPLDPEKKTAAIDEAMKDLRFFYRLVENLLSTKEEKERACQGAAADGEA